MIDETIEDIDRMQTQSSSVVAVRAAEALASLADDDCDSLSEFYRLVEQQSRALQRAKRSHAPLYTTQQRIVEAVLDAEAGTVEQAKQHLRDAVESVVTELRTSKERAAERAASLIDDGDVVLTTLIVDSAAGQYLPECDRVFVGMNCLVDDTVYNRVGTYPIAATAAHAGIPVTAVASSTKFIGSGFDFQNSYRPASEMMHEPVEGFEVANPGYDATPTSLLDSVVTEDAVIGF
ncbi:MAG: initiation factor 2B [Halobacteriales archaeon SW_9_67_25]|nr:MAG: initiation factor 2B [Halobacteriales archaeon SW_9_67_25]